jgi:hypothetical protein
MLGLAHPPHHRRRVRQVRRVYLEFPTPGEAPILFPDSATDLPGEFMGISERPPAYHRASLKMLRRDLLPNLISAALDRTVRSMR